eukprot:11339255-Ditylum_brightwellii.AAC.1
MWEPDEDLGDAMLTPEMKLKIAHATWWSEEVHNAHLVVKYCKVKLSQKNNNFNVEHTLEQIKEKLELEVDIYQGDPERKLIAQLYKTLKHKRKCRTNSFNL